MEENLSKYEKLLTKKYKAHKLSKEDKKYISELSIYDLDLFNCLLLTYKNRRKNKNSTAIEFSSIKNEFGIQQKTLDKILWIMSHDDKYKIHFESTHGLNQIRFRL